MKLQRFRKRPSLFGAAFCFFRKVEGVKDAAAQAMSGAHDLCALVNC